MGSTRTLQRVVQKRLLVPVLAPGLACGNAQPFSPLSRNLNTSDRLGHWRQVDGDATIRRHENASRFTYSRCVKKGSRLRNILGALFSHENIGHVNWPKASERGRIVQGLILRLQMIDIQVLRWNGLAFACFQTSQFKVPWW